MQVQGWKEYYAELVDLVFNTYHLRPEVITLGSLRFNRGLVSLCKARFAESDLFEYDFIVEGNDKERYKVEDRIELYKVVLDQLKQCAVGYDNGTPRVGLCKEKSLVWKKVGLDISHSSCNCTA